MMYKCRSGVSKNRIHKQTVMQLGLARKFTPFFAVSIIESFDGSTEFLCKNYSLDYNTRNFCKNNDRLPVTILYMTFCNNIDSLPDSMVILAKSSV